MQGGARGSQGDAMFEVVSLQRHSERTNGGRGRLQSPTEEEEPEEGLFETSRLQTSLLPPVLTHSLGTPSTHHLERHFYLYLIYLFTFILQIHESEVIISCSHARPLAHANVEAWCWRSEERTKSTTMICSPRLLSQLLVIRNYCRYKDKGIKLPSTKKKGREVCARNCTKMEIHNNKWKYYNNPTTKGGLVLNLLPSGFSVFFHYILIEFVVVNVAPLMLKIFFFKLWFFFDQLLKWNCGEIEEMHKEMEED